MKCIVIGVVLCLLVSSAWAGTLTDNFDDGDFDGWRMFTGQAGGSLIDQSVQWMVEKGELVGTSKDVCTWGGMFGIGDKTWKDYEFEFQFRIEKTFPTPAGCGRIGWPLVGFGVHYDNPSEFVVHGLDVVVLQRGGVFNDVICERWFQGGWFDVAGVGTISIEEWHTAKIIADGNQYKMFVNDQLLCDATHNLPDAGAAVLLVKNAEVHFDNVKITGDDIPNKSLGLPVESKTKLATTWGNIKNFVR